MNETKPEEKKKASVPIKVQLQQLAVPLKKNTAVVMRHFYFIFVMILIAAVGICIYYITQAFSISDEAYRTEKTLELTRSFKLKQDKETVDRVLQLETANAGPIQPNYDPSRDNPFYE